jgi:hypothetical protein
LGGIVDAVEQQQVLVGVGRGVASLAPAGWQRITIEFSGLVDMASSSVEIIHSDGRSEYTELPLQASFEMNKLRGGMYEKGKGTWFSARFVIEQSGDFAVDYNYDEEPPFPFELDPERYANDYRYYPRDWDKIPDWLRRKLRQYQVRQQKNISGD